MSERLAAAGRIDLRLEDVIEPAAREFPTVNGITAKGGSMDGPGPVVAGGMVFVNSGYGYFNAIPGNVLLAFSVDSR